MHALLWLYLGIYRFEYTARSTIRTGDGIFVVHLHLMLMHFDPKCRGAVGVCVLVRIQSPLPLILLLTHSFTLTLLSHLEKKTSFLFLINTHRTYTQKLIHKNERKKENYDRFCFGWQLTFHLFLFLLKKKIFWSFSLRKHTHNYNKT